MSNKIIHAYYASPRAKGFDVTASCQTIVDNGILVIPVNNATFGDPDPGQPKYFGILYVNPTLNSGNPIALGCTEGTNLNVVPIPQTATTPAIALGAPSADGPVQIVGAYYGTSRNGNNVTGVCQYLVNGGGCTLPINNNYLGPDPSPGATKYFTIQYTYNGTIYQAGCSEGSTLTLLPVPSPVPMIPTPPVQPPAPQPPF